VLHGGLAATAPEIVMEMLCCLSYTQARPWQTTVVLQAHQTLISDLFAPEMVLYPRLYV
jgi:hypothetical protein